MHTHFWRLVFSDPATLKDYLTGKSPDPKVIRRRLFVAERSLHSRYPDHYFRNVQEHNFGAAGPVTMTELVVTSLTAMARSFLQPHGDALVVRPERFAAWQHELPRLSPLAIVSAGLYEHFGAPGSQSEELDDYLQRHVLTQFQASAMPTVHDPQLEALIHEKGLCDVHVHLNGSTELDVLWLDVLKRPEEFSSHLAKASYPEAVLEQYAQLEPDLPADLHTTERIASLVATRIQTARRLRAALAEIAFQGRLDSRHSLPALANPAHPDIADFEATRELHHHPARRFIRPQHRLSDLACESLLYLRLLSRLSTQPQEEVARALHCYLLLLGAFAPFCVQQTTQYGFDQFQKITLNELRDMTETAYRHRLEQVSYRPHGDLKLIEGRFAPKDDPSKALALFRRVLAGFAEFHAPSKGQQGPPGSSAPYDLSVAPQVERTRRLDLRLVAHFIKRDQLATPPDGSIYRFQQLRQTNARMLRLLLQLRDQYPGIGHYLTGVDAAANELHTPPEVYAPLFRACRQGGFKHFTFHVGEDFEHLISGIRAVYEALCFLNLQPGNRIGHATAVGIPPALWLERTPNRMMRRKGDWLDDLIFTHHLLQGVEEANALLPQLRAEIATLSQALYGADLDPALLWSAWSLRHLDPEPIMDPGFDELAVLNKATQAEVRLVRRAEREHPDALNLFRRYHDPKMIQRSRALQPVETGLLDASLLRALQEKALAEVVRRRVVIEALFTSNVRISVYDDYDEHHIFRWLGLAEHDAQPMVCLGTDDPGIFATNLRNEYAHIQRELRVAYNQSEARTMDILRSIHANSNTYAFW